MKRMTDHFAHLIEHNGMAPGAESNRLLQADQIVGSNDAVGDAPLRQRSQDEECWVTRHISSQIGDDRFVAPQLAAKIGDGFRLQYNPR